MLLETDLNGVKKQTVTLAYCVQPSPVKEIPFFCIHPFVNTPMWVERMIKDGIQMSIDSIPAKYDLTNETTYLEWVKELKKRLDDCYDLTQIYMLYNNPWKLTFMRFCGQFLGEKDYAEYLANAWVTEENPNMDSNVSVSRAIQMFKSCKKEYLMEKEDLAYYRSLPSKIDIYRGVAEGRVKLGLSWTDDIEKAKWFQNRFGNNNYLLHLNVNKKDVIAYFNTRGEKEILLDVLKYKNLIEMIM